MDVQQKLSGFYKIITAEAIQKKNEMFNQIKNEIENEINQTFEKLCHVALQKINSEKFNLEQSANNDIVNKSSASRKKFFDLRNDFKTELFEQVEKMLRDFVNTSEYLQHVEKELALAHYENPIIEFSCCDKNLAEYINKKFGFQFFISKFDFIGGHKIYLNGSKIVIDKSFKNRLEFYMDEFNKFKLPNI